MREESLQKEKDSIRSLGLDFNQKELNDTIPSELVEVAVDLDEPVRRSQFQSAIISRVEELKKTVKRELEIAEREEQFLHAIETTRNVQTFIDSMRMNIEEVELTISFMEERMQENQGNSRKH